MTDSTHTLCAHCVCCNAFSLRSAARRFEETAWRVCAQIRRGHTPPPGRNNPAGARRVATMRLPWLLGALGACATASAGDELGSCNATITHYDHGGWSLVVNRHPEAGFTTGSFTAVVTYVVRTAEADGSWLDSQFVAWLHPWEYGALVTTRDDVQTLAIHVLSCVAYNFPPENSVRLSISELPLWREDATPSRY
jgi:hypothetical protein